MKQIALLLLMACSSLAQSKLAIRTKGLPDAVSGLPYQQALQAGGSPEPYTWTLSSGTLAPGLQLSTGGVISGTPATAGQYTFTVQVQDRRGGLDEQRLRLTVNPGVSITTGALPSVTVGTPYSQILTAQGGMPPLQWTLASGVLPSGLTLDSRGTISGTPTTAETQTFTVKVTDAKGATDAKQLNLTVASAVVVTTTALPAGLVGTFYQQSLSANGGSGGYTWTLASGGLPAGLSLAGGGIISGTPTAAGTSNFAVRATDRQGNSATANLSVVINAPLTVSTTALPGGAVGVPYTASVTATGGAGGNTWSVVSGALPAGIGLGADGTLSGTPTASGTANFTVQVRDSSGATTTKALTIVVAAPQLSITTSSLPGGTVGVPYTASVTATGGAGGNTWSVVSGALPAGIGLGADGTLSGTPTASGTANFTVQVRDSSGATTTKALTIVVAAPQLSITTSSLPGGTVGVPYTASVTATGGAGGNTWSVVSGALPAGIGLGADGTLSGIPTASGTANFTVQVRDSSGATTTKALTIVVAAPQLSITTSSLPGGTVGVPYTASVTATGGAGGNTWSVMSGALPAGIGLGADGTLSGTPTASGTANFTVQVRDSSGATTTKALTIVVAAPQLSITTSSLPGGTVGVPYTASVTATGGAGGNTWSVVSGALPAGIGLGADGTLSGTPTASGTANFTVQVRDNSGATTTKALTIVVAAPQLSITTSSLPGGTVGVPYTASVTATGGAGGNTWSVVSGALPAGIGLGADGTLSGIPTASGTANFTVQVRDSSGATTTKALTIVVAAPQLSITTSSLPGGTIGVPYTASVTATGGAGGNTWSVVSGALPAGIALGADGSLSGTPTTQGTANFTVQVRDSAGSTATKPLSIAVAGPQLSISTSSLPGGTVGVAYTASLSATGGAGGNNWSLSGGSLPTGIVLGPDGKLSGTPTTAGTASFTVQVKDSSGASATRELGMAISPAQITITTSTLPGGTVSVAYHATLGAAGGSGGYNWTVKSGSLPAGLSLSGTGSITGTASTPGTSNFSVQVTDSSNSAASQAFALTIAPASLAISTSSLPGGAVGMAYQQPLQATGGSGTYSWAVTTGVLPSGLSLSRTGSISGTPLAPGEFPFTLAVADGSTSASRAFTIAVDTPVSIVTSALRTGTVGSSYSETLSATGGGQPYTWAVASGQLPNGLSLDPATGIISGTPSVAGAFRILFQVTDSASARAAVTLSLTVNSSLEIVTPPTLATASAGFAYSQAFAANGGVPPYVWSIAGTLPAGLTFETTKGTLGGTPSQVGTFPITIQVTDASALKISRNFSLQVVSGLAIATPPVLPAASLTVAYSTTLQPAGGTAPYQWTVISGALPGGITFTGSGQISGTPTSSGTFNFTAQVTDANSNRAQKDFALTVAGPLVITSSALTSAATQAQYGQTLSATGGTPPYTWSVAAGSLPEGLTLEAPTGALAGTPTRSGDFTFTASVTDANGITAQRQFIVSVRDGMTFVTPGSVPSATAGLPYSFTLQASGGSTPYSWTIWQGSLPDGLSLNASSGIISGTPTATGTFNFTVQVGDATNLTAVRVHTIVVGVPPPPAISLNGLAPQVRTLEQRLVDIAISDPYPVDIRGVVNLTFAPGGANPVDDPAVQFSTGGRSAPFTIPANATHANFGASQFAIQTGSVAGAIQLNIIGLQAGGATLDVKDGTSQTMNVGPAPPVIRSMTLTRTGNGIQLQVTALSNTRELKQATVTFQPASGTSIENTQLTVPLTDVGTTWFQSPGSGGFGGQFTLTLPFTFNGNVSLSSVMLTLSNGAGDSASSSANY